LLSLKTFKGNVKHILFQQSDVAVALVCCYWCCNILFGLRVLKISVLFLLYMFSA